jgi:hypothetical protein
MTLTDNNVGSFRASVTMIADQVGRLGKGLDLSLYEFLAVHAALAPAQGTDQGFLIGDLRFEVQIM